MLKRNKWFVLAGLYTVLVITVSLVKIKRPVQVNISHADKLVHIGIYFFCTLIWFIAFRSRGFSKSFPKALLKASIVAFVLGIILEFAQEFTVTARSGDVKDVMANGVGIIIAALFLYQVKKHLPLNSIK